MTNFSAITVPSTVSSFDITAQAAGSGTSYTESFTRLPVPFNPITFTPDRRPLFAEAYGAARTVINTRESWGVANRGDRRTPLAGEDMTNPSTNGRLNWVRGRTTDLIPLGYARYSFTNIQGWTSYDNGSGTVYQPHFPSNPYSGLELTETKVYSSVDDKNDYAISLTPFTDNGTNGNIAGSTQGGSVSGTPGDSKAAWAAAIADLRATMTAAGITTANQQVVAYAGFRPTYTDYTMTAVDRTLLGVSKYSNRGNGWSGDPATSPGYTPDVGFDGLREGYSFSKEAMKRWWDYEIAGIVDLGFDSIGLDTGTNMYMNAEGMYNTGTGDKALNARTGSTALHDVFHNYGTRTFTEAVPLNYTVTPSDPTPWTAAENGNDAIYRAGPMWAYFGSWWGYVGSDNNPATYQAVIGNSSGGKVWYNSNNPQVGQNGSAFNPNNTEVHCVFQYNDSIQTYASAKVIKDLGWLALRQLMWDYKQAGIVVSAGGRYYMAGSGYPDNTTGVPVTSAMFFGYIQDLANGTISSRPTV